MQGKLLVYMELLVLKNRFLYLNHALLDTDPRIALEAWLALNCRQRPFAAYPPIGA